MLRLLESPVTRKAVMRGSEGGCWKSAIFDRQLAGILPYRTHGS